MFINPNVLDQMVKRIRELTNSGQKFASARTITLKEFKIESSEWSIYCSVIGKKLAKVKKRSLFYKKEVLPPREDWASKYDNY